MRSTPLRPLPKLALALLLAAFAAGAGAIQSGRTPQGLTYASGGVTHEDLQALHASRGAFSLWVVTAATKTGAHLADVQLTIRDSAGRVVLDERMEGPWLFVDLPLGRYEVQARLDGRDQKRRTTIHRGDRHQLFFYFDTGDDVSPDHRPPFAGNPYGG
jgi:hypothetical protein